MLVRKSCILLLAVDIFLGICLYIGATGMQEDRIPVFYSDAMELTETEPEETGPYRGLKPKVALTFDDGPHPVYTDQILDLLAEREVKATFFVIGKNVGSNAGTIKRMEEDGHMICNHTYDHVDLSKLSSTDACMQLCRTSDAVERITGVRPMFFRPPFGEWEKILGECTDMLPIMWTLDTLDWKTQDSMNSYHKVVDNVKEDDIILMHDFYAETVEATGYIVDYLLEEGYDLVTVDEMILE